MRLFLLASLMFTLGGDCEPREQTCGLDSECLEPFGGFGKCIQDHCSFLDLRCPSDYRWDDAAGSARANRCVPEEFVPDAGFLDATR